MKTATATIQMTITGDNVHDAELQALVQNGMDAITEAIDTAPGIDEITATVEMIDGEITETRKFNLSKEVHEENNPVQ